VLLPDGSVVDALPVDINMVVEGIATAENQTSGDQKTQLVDADGVNYDTQHPLPADGDSVYVKDIDWDRVTSTGWTGNVDDLFTCPGEQAGIYNDSSSSPKILYIPFCRTVYLNAVGLGCNLTGKTFSNVKLEFIGSDGTVRYTYDNSSNNTKYGTRLYSFTPTACVGIRFNFVTTNTDVGISNITIQKETNVVARLRALKPDGTVTDIDATTGGNLKVSIEELESGISVNSNSQLKTTNYDSSGTELFANRTATGTIDANGETVSVAFAGLQSAAVLITGTWVGTMVVEGSIDGGNTYGTVWVSYVNLSPASLGIPSPINSITTNGTYKAFQSSGFTHYRIRATAWTSGSATIVWSCVYAPSSFIYTSSQVIQQVVTDDNNSSDDNLLASGTFTGTATSTLGVAGIQVSLHADQNCSVYVEQSPDGTNWDISDYFRYFSGINNFGVTVQAINSYVRVRVVNVSLSATTHFRLQTALCPIVEALPRSLSQRGNLKVAIEEMEDKYGFGVENTPTDEMRVITPYRIVGATFTGTVLDPNFWTASLGTGGAATVGGAQLIVSTGDAVANNSVVVTSAKTARYVGGSASRFRSIFRIPDSGVANNTRRIGAFTTTDGAFLELSGTTFKIVTRKDSVDTAVSNGSFNGQLGLGIIIDTNVHTWEIYWQNSKTIFTVDGSVIHTVFATTNTWSSHLDLPIRIENTNSGGLQTNVSLNVRTATIHRLGASSTQPISKYQAGTTAGVVLKYGPGNLHGIAISGVNNNAVVTLYDNTAVPGTIIWSTGTMGANAVPFDIDFKGLAFSIGLTLVISGANANATVMYE